MAVRKGKAKSIRAGTPRRPKRVKGSKGGGPPFGAVFFTQVLPAMVNSCPPLEGHEPAVIVHLGDGHKLDVCQVVTVSERFCLLAAYEGTGPDGVERTADDVGLEAIPYDLVLRVTVRAAPKQTRRLGFSRVVPETASVMGSTSAKAEGSAPPTT